MNKVKMLLFSVIFLCSNQKILSSWFGKKPHQHELRFVHLNMYPYPPSKTVVALGMVDNLHYYEYQKANPDTASIVIPVNAHRDPHDSWAQIITESLFLPPINPEQVNSIMFSKPFKNLTIGIIQEPIMAELHHHEHAAYAMIMSYMTMIEQLSHRIKTITLLAYEGPHYEEYARLLIGLVSVLIQDHRINNELLYILAPNKKVMDIYAQLLQEERAPSQNPVHQRPSALVRSILEAHPAALEQRVSPQLVTEKKIITLPSSLQEVSSAYPEYQELLGDIPFDLPKNPKVPDTTFHTPSLPHVQQQIAVQSAALQRKHRHKESLPSLEISKNPDYVPVKPSAPPLEEGVEYAPESESSAPPLDPEELLLYHLSQFGTSLEALRKQLQEA